VTEERRLDIRVRYLPLSIPDWALRALVGRGVKREAQTDWRVVDVSLRPTEVDLMASSVTVGDLDLMNCDISATKSNDGQPAKKTHL
jgi:hypothetical protein